MYCRQRGTSFSPARIARVEPRPETDPAMATSGATMRMKILGHTNINQQNWRVANMFFCNGLRIKKHVFLFGYLAPQYRITPKWDSII